MWSWHSPARLPYLQAWNPWALIPEPSARPHICSFVETGVPNIYEKLLQTQHTHKPWACFIHKCLKGQFHHVPEREAKQSPPLPPRSNSWSPAGEKKNTECVTSVMSQRVMRKSVTVSCSFITKQLYKLKAWWFGHGGGIEHWEVQTERSCLWLPVDFKQNLGSYMFYCSASC